MTKRKLLDSVKQQQQQKQQEKETLEITGQGDEAVLLSKSHTVRTLDEALTVGDVDLNTWEVERYVINKWDSAGEEMWQVKVFLKRKKPAVKAIETLLELLAKKGPNVPKLKRKEKATARKRMYEIAIMDPHLGMHCFRPGADMEWSLEQCEQMCLTAVNDLMNAALMYGPFEYVLFPFGNDFLHADNIQNTTTAGTHQPEAEAWHHVMVRGEELGIGLVERMKEVAPVKVLVVPGNHARQSEFSLGRVLSAYYRNDKNVEVDASSSPYKFHHYGVNLLGFDHGHSIKPIRLASLMANECRDVWGETIYREWHCGDQHRKGSGSPVLFEEQSVSVEYLPSITPPNEWHRVKSFNWQKRAAMGFVWDKESGPIARLQVNVDSYTGEIM